MWKLISIRFMKIENNINSVIFSYENEKLQKNKSVAYFKLKEKKFRIIPEYDFTCMLVNFDDFEEDFKIYESSISWLGFSLHKRFNFI